MLAGLWGIGVHTQDSQMEDSPFMYAMSPTTPPCMASSTIEGSIKESDSGLHARTYFLG
jgi:hypothetical protein